MARRISAEDAKLAADVKKQQSELDIEFILRTATQSLIKAHHDKQIEMIVSAFHAIAAICKSGAEDVIDEAINRDDVTVDYAVDVARKFMETNCLIANIILLIEEYEEDDLFTTDQPTLDSSVEELRINIVRAKLQARKSRTTRRT